LPLGRYLRAEWLLDQYVLELGCKNRSSKALAYNEHGK